MASENLDLLKSHGVLNDMTDKSPKVFDPEKSNFLGTVRKETRELFAPRKLTEKNEFRAIVLRNNAERNIANTSKWSAAFASHGVFNSGMVNVVASIPEMYSHLPLPKDFNDHRVIDLYPVFSVSLNDLPAASGLQPGDIIKVNFEDVKNRSKPSITGIFKGGKDIARSDIFGSCPPAENPQPATRAGRTPSPQLEPSAGVNPCDNSNEPVNTPEQDHLGPVDSPQPPVSCGPRLFRDIYGTDQGSASQEEIDEATAIAQAAQGKWPILRPGSHSLWQQGNRRGKAMMMEIPSVFASKPGILIPSHIYPALVPMLLDMAADFWLPREQRSTGGPGVNQATEAAGYVAPNLEYDYSKLANGLEYGMPYPVPGAFHDKNKTTSTSGLINSGFRSYPQQVYCRLYNAVIDGKNRKNFQRGGGSLEEFSRWASSKGQVNGFNSLIEFLTKAPNNSSNFKPSTATPGYSTHQIGSAIDFRGFNPESNDEQGKQVYKWMANHAIHYGWIRTVKSEEWHWEYIGDGKNLRFTKWQLSARTERGYQGPPTSYAGADTESDEWMNWAKGARTKLVTQKWHGTLNPMPGKKRSGNEASLLSAPAFDPATRAKEIYDKKKNAGKEGWATAIRQLNSLGVTTPTSNAIRQESINKTFSTLIFGMLQRNQQANATALIANLNRQGIEERQGRGET